MDLILQLLIIKVTIYVGGTHNNKKDKLHEILTARHILA